MNKNYCCEKASQFKIFEFKLMKKEGYGFYYYNQLPQKKGIKRRKNIKLSFCPFCRKELSMVVESFSKILQGEIMINGQSI